MGCCNPDTVVSRIFARSAGQQVAMDVTRGLLQGTSGYLAKKFRTVKVKLKAGYRVMLYAKPQSAFPAMMWLLPKST